MDCKFVVMIRLLFTLGYFIIIPVILSCSVDQKAKCINNITDNKVDTISITPIKTEIYQYKKDMFMGFYRLCNTYSNRILIYASDHIGRREKIKEIILPFDKIDYSLYDKNIDSIFVDRPNLLDDLLDAIYLSPHRDLIIKYMYNWSYLYSTMTTAYSLESPIYIEEVLYKNSYTKEIVRSFFNHSDQDWGSLSSSQLSELPFRVCNNFYKKDEKELFIFCDSFFKTLIQLIEDSGNVSD